MKKENLIKVIDRSNRIEEELIESLAKHINAASNWGGLAPDDGKRVSAVLNTLMQDSKNHFELLKSFKKRILQEKKDVY